MDEERLQQMSAAELRELISKAEKLAKVKDEAERRQERRRKRVAEAKAHPERHSKLEAKMMRCGNRACKKCYPPGGFVEGQPKPRPHGPYWFSITYEPFEKPRRNASGKVISGRQRRKYLGRWLPGWAARQFSLPEGAVPEEVYPERFEE